MSLCKRAKLNREKNLIKGRMPYRKYTDDQGNKKVVVAPNIETLDYVTFQSAYNPNYEDAGKIVRIPENYLYPNERHHLKDFVIVDGKENSNGHQVIIGFLGTSQINRTTRPLTRQNENELIAIQKVVLDKNRYHRLIRKSRTTASNRILSGIQVQEIKEQSKTIANINKSRRFRQ